MVFITDVCLCLFVCVSHLINVRDKIMTFDSWLCNLLIQEDSKVCVYHPTTTPTQQQDIFTLSWAEAGAKHYHHQDMSVWERFNLTKHIALCIHSYYKIKGSCSLVPLCFALYIQPPNVVNLI